MIPKTLKKLSASPRTALWLMSLTGAACLAGALGGREGYFGSPAFLILAALACGALAHAGWLRLYAVRRGAAQLSPLELARRLAPALFHLGLVAVAAAGLMAYGFEKRGFVQLMEGEEFDGAQEGFLVLERGAWAGRLDLPFALRMGRLKHEHWEDGELRELASSVTVVRRGLSERRTVAVNRPLGLGGVRVYQSQHYGYSVSLRVRKPGGEEAVTHFLLDRPARPGLPAVGGADFPTTPYEVRLRLVGEDALRATVTARGKEVYDGPLQLDAPVRMGEDLLEVADLRPWSGLIVVSDRSHLLATAGFVLAVAGGLLMFAFPARLRGEASHA